MCEDPALSWYEEYSSRVLDKKRNYHAFILELRKKVIPSTAGLDLWKEWKEYNYAKQMKEHGPNPPVNLHSLKCLRYYQECINPQGEKMINMHALKVKFVTTLLIHIKTPTKLLINYNIKYKKIVETLERMQADNARDSARGIANRGKTFYFNKEGRKIRQKTPEERGRLPGFQRSIWKNGDPLGQEGSAPDKPKRSYSPRSTASRKGPTKPRQENKVFRQMSDQEKESLKAQGKCLICKELGYYARDYPKKKSISIAYNQVSQRKP